MDKSRTKNALRNISSSILFQMINIIVKFAMRTVFIYCLGKEYLGINGVFANVLSILALTELGLGTAIVYSMYQPIANDDKNKISQYVKYYKKIYMVIGVVIFCIGSALLPFLDRLITDLPNVHNIRLIYSLYLLQSTSSYFFAQYSSLIEAYQMTYECRKIQIVFSVAKAIAQSVFLIVTKNFIIYLLIDIAIVICTNYVIYLKVITLFPFIRECKGCLDIEEKKTLWKNAMSNFSIKMGVTIINSTDNLVISACISTVLVGLYSNYAMIIQIILTSAVLIQRSVMAGIGNVCATEGFERKCVVFNRLLFMYGGMFAVISTVLYGVLQSFIFVWVGKSYIMDKGIVCLIILNCYLSGMHQVNETFIFSDGLYRFFKWKPWVEALINLVISVLLAKYIGIMGVLLGTTISHVLLTFWYDAYIVCKYSLKEKLIRYFKMFFKYMLGMFISVGFMYLFLTFSPVVQESLAGLVINAIVSLLIVCVVWLVMFKNSSEMTYFFNIMKRKKDNSDE